MKMIERLRDWLRQRRIRKLKLDRAELLGRLTAHYAAGYEAPSLEGRLGRVIAELSLLGVE